MRLLPATTIQASNTFACQKTLNILCPLVCKPKCVFVIFDKANYNYILYSSCRRNTTLPHMDKEKLKKLQFSSDAFADQMGWPRIKVSAEFHEAVSRGSGRASLILSSLGANQARPKKIVHRLKARKSVLDDEIELARARALNPNAAASIFAEMVKLAEKQEGCLIGVDEEAVKYQVGAEVKFFTVRHLRARLKRANLR